LLIAVILSYITSKRQAKPINDMANAARRFAHGDFSVRVAMDGDRVDEIGELTASFNAMAESLEKSEELRREFIANVSHELKTPMTTISGFADGLLDGTIPRENQEKYLLTISEETKRLSRLVRRMLELSRIQSGAKEALRQKDFDVSEVLRRTLLNLERKITDKNLNVDAQLPEESMTVLGDGDAITQVVYNLLDNAIKFSEPGSTLGLALWKEGSKAFVSVKNCGETISDSELPLIFDRFHKTDRSRSRDREGVGLGLYIVKTILNQHDEDIFVTSKNGVTEFVFTLTLKQQSQKN
jgi:signal transduction histidine kinase